MKAIIESGNVDSVVIHHTQLGGWVVLLWDAKATILLNAIYSSLESAYEAIRAAGWAMMITIDG